MKWHAFMHKFCLFNFENLQDFFKKLSIHCKKWRWKKGQTSFTMMFAFPLVPLTNYFHNIAQLDTFFSSFRRFPSLIFMGNFCTCCHSRAVEHLIGVFVKFQLNRESVSLIKKGFVEETDDEVLELVMGEVSGDGEISSSKHAVNDIIKLLLKIWKISNTLHWKSFFLRII